LRKIHAIENDGRKLMAPLRPEEILAIQERELAVGAAMSHGALPSLRDVAAYVYGKGRVRFSPKPT
jgi:hypothetical protein